MTIDDSMWSLRWELNDHTIAAFLRVMKLKQNSSRLGYLV